MSPLFSPWILFLWLLLDTAQAEEPLRLITVGDSITRGVRPDVKQEQTFAALIQQDLQAKGYLLEVINAGIGGDTVDAGKKLQAGVVAKKPDFVTLMYGTNDSYIAKGQTKERNTLSQYEEALRAMVGALKEAGIVPILMTPPPWAEGAPHNGLDEDPNVRLLPYVEVCRALAEEMKLPLVDHHRHWSEAAAKGTLLRSWTSDFCHPNARGHQELATEILRTLPPLLKQRREPIKTKAERPPTQ